MKRFTILLCTLFFASICYAQSTCGVCGGTGAVSCPNCGGRGYVTQTVYNPYFGYQNTTVTCPNCWGYRQVVCYNCGGRGQIPSQYNPSFGAGENSDGYIKDGTIELTRVVSKTTDTFVKYTKGSGIYVKSSGRFICVNSSKQVKINNIDYYGI